MSAASAATRQASAPRTWAAWIPRGRVDARDNPDIRSLSDRQRVLLLILEYVWKSKPYGFVSNAELAAMTGWDERKVQRTLEELERDGCIHREVIPGRIDRVGGRPSVTGRVGIVALERLSDQPVATRGQDLDQVIAAMNRDLARRQPPTVHFPAPTAPMGARQNRHRVHDNSGDSYTTNLSSPFSNKEERTENTTTSGVSSACAESPEVHECNQSSSLTLLLEPESESDRSPGAEPPRSVSAPEIPVACASTQTIFMVQSPAPTPPASPAVAELPAELVKRAAEVMPEASATWLANLLHDCDTYGLELALLVVAWVKVRRPDKPTRYARVALAGWLNKLRAGAMTLEDVRVEVQGRSGPRASPRPFDPAACLARLASHGWTMVASGPNEVIRTEIPSRGAPLWKTLPSELRQQVEAHQGELKAYVLKRASERGKAVGRGA
jgi:DNA-binding Lrp family transcriptional regulator